MHGRSEKCSGEWGGGKGYAKAGVSLQHPPLATRAKATARAPCLPSFFPPPPPRPRTCGTLVGRPVLQCVENVNDDGPHCGDGGWDRGCDTRTVVEKEL